MLFVSAGVVLAIATLVHPAGARVAFWSAPLVVSFLCASLATRCSLAVRGGILVAGLASQAVGVVVSIAVLVLLIRVGFPGRSPGLVLFTWFLPGAVVAALLFLIAYRVLLGTAIDRRSVFLVPLTALAASVALGLSAEAARLRPWVLGHRIDGFPELSGLYILVWFVALPRILPVRGGAPR